MKFIIRTIMIKNNLYYILKMRLPQDLEDIVFAYESSMVEYDLRVLMHRQFNYENMVNELGLILSCCFDGELFMIDFCLTLVADLKRQRQSIY